MCARPEGTTHMIGVCVGGGGGGWGVHGYHRRNDIYGGGTAATPHYRYIKVRRPSRNGLFPLKTMHIIIE